MVLDDLRYAVRGMARTPGFTAIAILMIMPRAFGGPHSRNNNDGWLPVGPGIGGESRVGCTAGTFLWLFARLRQGATFEATADQATLASGLPRIPDNDGTTGRRVVLEPLHRLTTADVQPALLSLLGCVGLVLLIACANVANLQLERVFGRRRETAVRMAIGATRARIVRQALTENLLLYLAGCAGGLLAAAWTLQLIVALLPASMPGVIGVAMNARVLAATIAIACATGLVAGFLPALQAASPRLVEDLRAAAGTTKANATRLRTTLVIAQIALSVVLVVGAALMIRTFLTLRPDSPGFTATDKLTTSIRLQGPRASAPREFFDPLFERLRRLPGVHGVTASTYLPVSGNIGLATIRGGDQPVEVFSGVVLPNYFDEMRRGRIDASAAELALRRHAVGSSDLFHRRDRDASD